MGSIEVGVAAIEALEPGQFFSYTTVAETYGVERVTLSRRHQHRFKRRVQPRQLTNESSCDSGSLRL